VLISINGLCKVFLSASSSVRPLLVCAAIIAVAYSFALFYFFLYTFHDFNTSMFHHHLV
jgi:hypothetical protein